MCPQDAWRHVGKSVWPILSAVPLRIERVYVLRNSALLEELAAIKVGSIVNVMKDGY